MTKKRIRNYKEEYWRSGRARYFKAKAEHRTWYDLNKQKALKLARKWCRTHKKLRREIANRYYHKHRREVCARNRKKYWQNVKATRKKEREDAKKRYWKNPKKSREKLRNQYTKNPELYRIASGWNNFRKRYGLNLTLGKEQYKCLRLLRKELTDTVKLWKEGGISDTEMHQRSQHLALKLQQKLSTKMRRV